MRASVFAGPWRRRRVAGAPKTHCHPWGAPVAAASVLCRAPATAKRQLSKRQPRGGGVEESGE